METTITLECSSRKRGHFKELEHELKQIHGLKVFFVEPRDSEAPILISLSVLHQGEHAELAIRRIAHTLFAFIHGNTDEPAPLPITLVTIGGESRDLTPLAEEEIRQIISEAHAGQV
ncbi:MAG TPA: hypothetical protein VHD63_03240 [Ktedonobacteraceae bacterium]|jgi:hypothetical protein|nr:hypothetical protein [Ktedonobacteraceae bacterium]